MKRNDFQTFIQIGLSLGGGLLLAAVWLLITNPLATVEAQGSDGHSIYCVAPDGNCGVGVEPCFSDVQLAVDAVDDAEDVIKVAATNFSPGTPVAVGSGPWGIVYEPVHDQIYVANSGDSSVTVLRAPPMAP